MLNFGFQVAFKSHLKLLHFMTLSRYLSLLLFLLSASALKAGDAMMVYTSTGLSGGTQIAGVLPGQLVQSLPGEVVPSLPGQKVAPLSGQLVTALPGQLVQSLPGQVVGPLTGQLQLSLPRYLTLWRR